MKIEIEGAKVNEKNGSVCGVSYHKLDEDSVKSVQIAVNDRKKLVATPNDTKKDSYGTSQLDQRADPKTAKKCCCHCCLAIFLILVLLAGGIASLILYFLPNYMSHRIFSVDVNRDANTNYSDLSAVKFIGRNFYLQKDGSTSKNISSDPELSPSLGTWHILPSSLSAEFNNSKSYEEVDMEKAMSQGSQKVAIYFHGSGSTRVSRAHIFNVISGMDYHTISADYRGYGDSTGEVTEDGLNDDAHTIYNYAKSKSGPKPVIVWSHSMGTAVSTRLVAELSDRGTPPLALILSAAYNNLHDVFNYTAYAQNNPLRFVPWFDELITLSMNRAHLQMATDKNIARVKCPIFIMHAADDTIVPIQLTQKLVDAAQEANRTFTYFEFPANRNLGHRSVQLAQEVPLLIRKFLTDNKLEP